MTTEEPTPFLFPSDPEQTPEPSEPTAEAKGDLQDAVTAEPHSKKRSSAQRPRKSMGGGRDTPMMQQFFRAKKEVGDALLFFRMGDFYELFFDDAKVASRVLGITLTSRSKDKDAIPMAGVPVKAYEGYLHTLIREGFRVAICDQMEDPKHAKGIVDRQVTRIITAGTLMEDDLLDHRANNYLLAAAPVGDTWGLSWIDVSTGDFRVASCSSSELANEISRLAPSEILLPEARRNGDPELVAEMSRACPAPIVPAADWTFQQDNSLESLTRHLKVRSMAGFGLDDEAPYIGAAGALLAYTQETLRGETVSIHPPRLHDRSATANLDRATCSCLELVETQKEGQREGSLLSVLDETSTAMGSRLLRDWIVAPLIDPQAIELRQAAVAELLDRQDLSLQVTDSLSTMPDLERITTRLLAGRGSPRDLAALRDGLEQIPVLKAALDGCDSAPLAEASKAIHPLPELTDTLVRGLTEHPPLTLRDGGLIARGFHDELDELIALREDGASAITAFQESEARRVGISSLKVSFNKVFGYYIEITHAQATQAAIPEEYVRKQTLTNAERYITSELKDLETRILSAEERAKSLEEELFIQLRQEAAKEGESLRVMARAVAAVDVLNGFSSLAKNRAWIRPTIDDGEVIEIQEGRHPVLETLLPPGEFIPNDVMLDRESARLVLITGPNMAGKSTYIRQVALLVLLAQIGSFVPAQKARIGVVDRILTRVGASDNLTAGQSTFMVEMTETAAILNEATERSLVILDEVGRGTSTWDGLSLAWAVSEYLYRAIGARTLFATHYHELVDLAEEFPAVCNVNVAVKEWGDDIVFLHKIVQGGTDRSYGLHVARLAGVPSAVIDRARRILHDLESTSPDLKPGPQEPVAGGSEPEPSQGRLFPKPAASILQNITEIDPDLVSPLEALLLLKEFRARLTGEATDSEEEDVDPPQEG
ncbi:MAG: DNA mismatch repair protein MutS [Planctomycetota bacterium]|nr:DNA mismatch repair protein MutS [Planctomycetota bacterium]